MKTFLAFSSVALFLMPCFGRQKHALYAVSRRSVASAEFVRFDNSDAETILITIRSKSDLDEDGQIVPCVFNSILRVSASMPPSIVAANSYEPATTREAENGHDQILSAHMTDEDECVYVEKTSSGVNGVVPHNWSAGGRTDLPLPDDWPDPAARESQAEADISGSIKDGTLTVDLRDRGHQCRFVWNPTDRVWERRASPTSEPSTKPVERDVAVQLPVHQGLDELQSFLGVAIERKAETRREVEWHFLLFNADNESVEEVCHKTTIDDQPVGTNLGGAAEAKTTAVLSRDKDDHQRITLTNPTGSTVYQMDLTGDAVRWTPVKSP